MFSLLHIGLINFMTLVYLWKIYPQLHDADSLLLSVLSLSLAKWQLTRCREWEKFREIAFGFISASFLSSIFMRLIAI